MTKRYCPYCGGLIGYCNCEAEAERNEQEFLDEYYSDASVCQGLAQQDMIDLRKRER